MTCTGQYKTFTIQDVAPYFPLFVNTSSEKAKDLINRGSAFKMNAAPLPTGEVFSGRSKRWQVIEPALGTNAQDQLKKVDLNKDWYSYYTNDQFDGPLGTPLLTHSHFFHPCHPPRRSVWSNQFPQLSLAADWKARTLDTCCVPRSFLTD